MPTMTPDEALGGALRRHALAVPGTDVTEVAAGLAGLHNTTQTSPYLSLLARIPGFTRPDLDTTMWGSWRLARLRAMRLAAFVMPRDLMEVTAAAMRHVAEPYAARWLRDSGMSQREFDRVASAVHEALGDGPLTVRALRRVLGLPAAVDVPGVVSRMCDAGRLAAGRPPRSWRSSVRRYHRWEDVLAEVDLFRWDETAAIGELVRRYVRSYGPVTIADVSWWTGITKGRCRAALAGLDVEEVAVEGWPGPLYRARGAPPSGGPDDPVHALPLLDPYVQGYRDRIRFLDADRFGYVYDGGGNSAATLLHRGRIVGVWQVRADPAPSVRYHLFGRAPGNVRRRAEEALAAAGHLWFDRPVDVVPVAAMAPLGAGGGRSAAHPLDATVHRSTRRKE